MGHGLCVSHVASSPGWWHAALGCFLGGNEGHVQENEAKTVSLKLL